MPQVTSICSVSVWGSFTVLGVVDDGVEPANNDARPNGLNHCSTRAEWLLFEEINFGVLLECGFVALPHEKFQFTFVRMPYCVGNE